MSKRAAAAEATRRRIVDATRALHTEQGVAATSWEDIAKKAGVGVGTVYRHFPSLDELVPACGEVSMQAVALPDRKRQSHLFDGADGPDERIERLVAEVFAIWERGADEVRVTLRERGVHPSLTQIAEQVDSLLARLVRDALEPLDATDVDRRVARAMIDLATWDALRAQGLDPAEAEIAVREMLAGRLARR